MKLNKEQTTKRILDLAGDQIRQATKLPTETIIFPRWSEIGLLGEVLCMRVKTKEQPAGCDYDEDKFQVVIRIIGGKVHMTGGYPDAYAWKQSKVEPYLEDSKAIRFIGTNSAEAVLNLSAILNTIDDNDERLLFADMFCSIRKDLLLVSTKAEERRCIEVSRSLYDAGVVACVDAWMQEDEFGMADSTQLNVGDFLIIEGSDVYCIRHDEFIQTHKIHG